MPILCNWILDEKKYANYHHNKIHAHAGEALSHEEVEIINKHVKEETNHPEQNDFFQKVKTRFTVLITRLMLNKKRSTILYLVVVSSLIAIGFVFIGKDLLPKSNNGQFQMRIKAPEGERLERTEEKVQQALSIIDSTVSGHVEVSSAYVGLIPSSYATNNLYVFNTGTHEAIIQVKLAEDYKIKMDELKDTLRENLHRVMPDVQISFEPIDLTEKIMSQGAANPIEVRVGGKDLVEISKYSDSLLTKMQNIACLRDVQIQQPLHFPTISILLNRFKLAQFGLTVQQVANSVTSATSSSRFIEKNLWLDEKSAYTYQVQVQVPEYQMNAMNELKELPLIKGKNRPMLEDVADFKMTTAPGEYDRAGPRRYLTIGASVNQKDLGTATTLVEKAIASIGDPPKGVKVEVKGMSALLIETLSSLQNGLLFAVLVILLLLAANYESFPVALTVVSTVPAVVLGSISMLMLTGSTLNLQSYMGMIMSIGVSIANAILIVTNAERLRLEVKNAENAAITSAAIRLRPILMTSLAMIAGMVPMAAGLGEGGEQAAPLGRAVIGGLIASTFAALFILPQIYAWVRSNASFKSSSLLHKSIK